MKRRKVLLVLGKTGSGKSYYVKSLLEGISRLIIFDPRHEYTGGMVFEDFYTFRDYVADHIEEEEFRYICRFMDDEEYNYAAELVWIIGDCTLVLEESELFLSSFDRDPKLPINFLVSQGRHHSVGIIAISRRPSELSIKLRSVVDVWVSFNQTEPKDLSYCEYMGLNVERIPILKVGEYETTDSEPAQAETD